MKAFRALLLLLLTAAPLTAQGRGQPPTQTDTVIVRRTSAGFVVNFDDQPLRVVFSALAEASGLNIVQTNIPLRNTTLHMGSPVSRDDMLDVIKGLAASNGVTVIEGPSLVRLEGPTPQPTATQQQLAAQQAAQQASQQQLYVHRLKHASAVQLAPVLQGLFSGITRQPTAAQLAAQNPLGALIGAAIGGGRAGRGGADEIIGLPTTVTEVPVNPGRGGNAGRGNAGRGQAQQQQALSSLSSSAADIRIQAEESSNTLLIRATAADYALIQQVLTGVDLRPLQVLIEVMIAEVTRTRDLNVGVTVNEASTNPKTENGTTVAGRQESQAGTRDFILQLTGGRGGVSFDVAVNALQSRGDLRVLSLPVIIAENNRQAILNVGSSRPFVQVSQSATGVGGGVVQTVQYIDVGTVLTITPTINPDGYVNLQIQQTANSASNEIQFDAPVINKREATTQVFIRDGQTTVIGGLADNSSSNSESGIPILSRIPGLGWLFGSKQRNRATSELFLFLTPHVIFTDTDVDELRDAVKRNSELLQTVPIESRINPKGDTIVVKLPPLKPDTIRKPPTR
jgi:general secretion pathway protein D